MANQSILAAFERMWQHIVVALGNKVDKVDGKGLSTKDFTEAYETKLKGVAEGATKVIVDAALSSNSNNAVRNSAVATQLHKIIDEEITPMKEAVSTHIYETYPAMRDEVLAHQAKLNGISDGANKVEASMTNGNIKVDGTEVQVYDSSSVLPISGGNMTGTLGTNGIKLTSGTDYGSSTPSDTEEGKLFFVEDNDGKDLRSICQSNITPTFARVISVGGFATLQLQFTCSEQISKWTAITQQVWNFIPVSVYQNVFDVTNTYTLQVRPDLIQTSSVFPAGTYTFNFPLY